MKQPCEEAPTRPPRGVACREIQPSDLEAVIDLLTKGFQRLRKRVYWVRVVRRLSQHKSPPGYPRFGYLLESDGTPIGVLLTIFSVRQVNGTDHVRCNGSSLYVEPAFTVYAPLLIRRAERHKNVTYLNTTPAAHTWASVEAQGYTCLSTGQFVCVPLLARPAVGAIRVRDAGHGARPPEGLEPFEVELLASHAGYDCICLVCEYQGTAHPFVFGRRRKFGIPMAHLYYCRDQTEFGHFAASLGRHLLRCGILFAVLDADGPLPGLIGRYVPRGRRYWRGPESHRIGDLAYTEVAMFGY
jgi:hypothetical protein